MTLLHPKMNSIFLCKRVSSPAKLPKKELNLGEGKISQAQKGNRIFEKKNELGPHFGRSTKIIGLSFAHYYVSALYLS